jgi:hypothetical protein
MKRGFFLIKTLIFAAIVCISGSAYAAAPVPHMPVDVTAQGSFIYPMGDLGDMFKYGTGGTLAVSWRDAFFPGFTLGLKQSNWYFSAEDSDMNWAYMAGLSVSAGYSVEFAKFAVTPGFSIGYTYTTMAYRNYRDVAGQYDEKVERGFDPLFTAGFSVLYSGFNPLVLSLGADYGMIIEQNGFMSFLSGMLGVGLRL